MKRIGIVGAGIIGKTHKEAIDGNDQCCLAAVCDVVREKAEELAKGTDAKVYTDYKEMAAEVEMDAVILNLPHFLHKDVTIYFLERKIPVLVEKPMALNVQECDEMIAAAKANDTLLAVGHVYRYEGFYRKVKEIIEQGTLGELCMVTECRNTNYFAPSRPRWFLDKEKAGGGIVMNFGAHSIDKLLYTTGATAVEIKANGSNMLNDANIEAAAQVLLKLSNGASVALTYSGCEVPYFNEVVFYFTKGCVKQANGLWIAKDGGSFEKLEAPYDKTKMGAQLEEFIKYLDGEESEIVTPEYGREVIRVIEEVVRQIGE